MRGSSNDAKSEAHAEDPGTGDDWIAVFLTEVHEALVGGFVGFGLGADFFGFIFVGVFWVAGFFKGAGEVVCCYDCCGMRMC